VNLSGCCKFSPVYSGKCLVECRYFPHTTPGVARRFVNKSTNLQQAKTESLKKEIGAAGIAFSTMNLMVGTGIFFLPALVAGNLGATALLAYFVCGLLVFCLGLCFAELGSKSNLSGGPYTFIEKAFGPYAGFLASNLYVLGALASDAALANGLSDTLQAFIPQLRIDTYRMLFHFCIFAGLAWLNISSVKNGTRFVVFAGVGKLVPLVLLVVIAMPYVKTANLEWVIVPTVSNIGSASLLLFFAFLGLEVSLCNGGEIKNPARNVPLGLFVGIAMVLVLYISIQVASQGILGNDLASNKAAPLATLAHITMGQAGMIFIIAVTALSIIGSLSGEILAVPRILFATARDGLMPAVLAKVHPRFATPHIAILVYAGIGYCMSVSGGFRQLAVIASASLIIIYFGTSIAVLQLRRRKPQVEAGAVKTFRIPGGPVVPLVAAAGSIWLLSNSSKAETLGIAAFILIFSAIYFVMQLLKKKQTTIQNQL
jgi:APA family basic amino acid/polyamine antiporter